jgi:hypothetical protein
LTTSAALRVVDCVFAAAVMVTDDSPWPELGLTCSQDAVLDADQLHSRAALTVTLTPPPDAGNVGAGLPSDVWQRTAAGPVS